MKIMAQIISWVCLIVLMVPSILFLAGKMTSLDQVKWVMFLTTILWFIVAPLWMWNASE